MHEVIIFNRELFLSVRVTCHGEWKHLRKSQYRSISLSFSLVPRKNFVPARMNNNPTFDDIFIVLVKNSWSKLNPRTCSPSVHMNLVESWENHRTSCRSRLSRVDQKINRNLNQDDVLKAENRPFFVRFPKEIDFSWILLKTILLRTRLDVLEKFLDSSFRL